MPAEHGQYASSPPVSFAGTAVSSLARGRQFSPRMAKATSPAALKKCHGGGPSLTTRVAITRRSYADGLRAHNYLRSVSIDRIVLTSTSDGLFDRRTSNSFQASTARVFQQPACLRSVTVPLCIRLFRTRRKPAIRLPVLSAIQRHQWGINLVLSTTMTTGRSPTQFHRDARGGSIESSRADNHSGRGDCANRGSNSFSTSWTRR